MGVRVVVLVQGKLDVEGDDVALVLVAGRLVQVERQEDVPRLVDRNLAELDAKALDADAGVGGVIVGWAQGSRSNDRRVLSANIQRAVKGAGRG